jgi:hypothetical protein
MEKEEEGKKKGKKNHTFILHKEKITRNRLVLKKIK